MNESDVEAYMRQPWNMTCTDGGLVTFGSGAEHPRAYGAFPRKIRRYALDRGAITLEHAIHTSTGLSAGVLNIQDRGVLRAGAYADVVVFNPETINDPAAYDAPHAYSTGMDYVLVNGKFALAEGKVLPERHGRVLLRHQQ
jgi:N-acyl-D-aspartate/D-glutamate deacylase